MLDKFTFQKYIWLSNITGFTSPSLVEAEGIRLYFLVNNRIDGPFENEIRELIRGEIEKI